MRDRTTLILLGVVLALAGLAWNQGGSELAGAGLLHGLWTLLRLSPLLVAAFVIAGLIQVFLTQETVSRWLGAESGWRGILLACASGSLVPGGPFIYYPIAATLFRAGASLGVVVAFVSAKNLWPLVRLPLEFALLGPRLTLIRLALTLFAPPLLGFLAQGLLGHLGDQIRERMGP
jgi:uncharacterized membrane protein YraQ (UPF0718 family)